MCSTFTRIAYWQSLGMNFDRPGMKYVDVNFDAGYADQMKEMRQQQVIMSRTTRNKAYVSALTHVSQFVNQTVCQF